MADDRDAPPGLDSSATRHPSISRRGRAVNHIARPFFPTLPDVPRDRWLPIAFDKFREFGQFPENRPIPENRHKLRDANGR